MIFSQETAQAVPSEDLPDDFFELTISDAKKLLKDIKRARLEMDNAPLHTTALRNLEKSKRQLSQLNRYKQSIIRVNFPDHTVLQGTFSPVDTITTVLEFVREYLEDKQMDFYLCNVCLNYLKGLNAVMLLYLLQTQRHQKLF